MFLHSIRPHNESRSLWFKHLHSIRGVIARAQIPAELPSQCVILIKTIDVS